MEKFAFSENSTNENSVAICGENSAAIVEHILCTKPLTSSPPSPLLGQCVVSHRLLGNKIICLTATLQCIAFPLRQSLRGVTLLSEYKDDVMSHKTTSKEPFDNVIRKLLIRDTSNPILNTQNGDSLGAEQCLQLLCRVTEVLRSEYIIKQMMAEKEILQRIRLLGNEKREQFQELERLKQEEEELREYQQNCLQLKYQLASKQQMAILQRITALSKAIQDQIPFLSNAEKSFLSELKELKLRCESFQEKAKQLIDKHDYNEKIISREKRDETEKKADFSPADFHRIKSVLEQESDDIANLVQKVGSLKVNLQP